MEQTRNEDDARKNKRWNTEEGRVQKTDINSSRKIDHRIFWIFWVKNRYGDDEKKVKKKYEKQNEIKNKRERRKIRWNKKKIHKNGDGDKKLRKHEIQKKSERETLRWRNKERMEKWERRKKVRKAKRDEQEGEGEKVNKEQSDERNSENVERKKKWNKKETEQKQKLKIFGLNFVVVKSEEREGLINVIPKSKRKIKRIFSHTKCFWNQENRNRKQKKVFPTFSSKNNILIFGYITTQRRVKKRKRVQKMKQKKGEIYKMRNHFSRHRQKPNMEKELNFWKKTTKKETKKTQFFFLIEKRRQKRIFFCRSLKRHLFCCTKSLT